MAMHYYSNWKPYMGVINSLQEDDSLLDWVSILVTLRCLISISILHLFAIILLMERVFL